MEREQVVVAAKLSVAAGLKRALPMRWEFTWIGRWRRKTAEGFELLRGPWQRLVAGLKSHLLRVCERIGLKRALHICGGS